MALTADQKIEVKSMIYEELPCATNKVCKEVSDVKTSFKWTVALLAGILFALILNFVVEYSKAASLEYRLNRIDAVMGINDNSNKGGL